MEKLNFQHEFELYCNMYERYAKLTRELHKEYEQKNSEKGNLEKEVQKSWDEYFSNMESAQEEVNVLKKKQEEQQEKQYNLQTKIERINIDIENINANLEYVSTLKDNAFECVKFSIENLCRETQTIKFELSQQEVLARIYAERENMAMFRILDISKYCDSDFAKAYANKDCEAMKKLINE